MLEHCLFCPPGPPGTGKTYVGVQIAKLLLHNTVPIARATGRWRLRAPQDDAAGKPVIGPLLCVCYTNHALDQFLMDLQRAGITNMVRIGGGCVLYALLHAPCALRPCIAGAYAVC